MNHKDRRGCFVNSSNTAHALPSHAVTTQLISFEGASDDTAIVIVDGKPEEYDAYNGAQFHIVSRSGQMQVTLDIDDNSGCWSIGLGQTDEAHPMPEWPVTVSQSRDTDYSARITITAPADAELVEIA